jgi:hypothetical protein
MVMMVMMEERPYSAGVFWMWSRETAQHRTRGRQAKPGKQETEHLKDEPQKTGRPPRA